MNRFRRFFLRWQNGLAFLLILIYVFAAIAAPKLSPQDPKQPGMFLRVGRAVIAEPQPPSEKARLGMLPHGLDVYHSLIWGSRDALTFGLIVTFFTAVFGILYGAVAGIASARMGSLLLRIADAFLSFPPIAGLVLLQQLLATTLTAMAGLFFDSQYYGVEFETKGPVTMIQFVLEHINPLMLSLIVFSWMPYARLVHSVVLTLKQTEYVQAARALGANPWWVIRKHLLINSTGPAIVLAARDIGGFVLWQATLTFVEIGGGSVWGTMLAEGRNWIIGPGGNLFRYWWVFLPPTLAIMLFGIAWNILGDGLNDVLEPSPPPGSEKKSFLQRVFHKNKKQISPTDQIPVVPAA